MNSETAWAAGANDVFFGPFLIGGHPDLVEAVAGKALIFNDTIAITAIVSCENTHFKTPNGNSEVAAWTRTIDHLADTHLFIADPACEGEVNVVASGGYQPFGRDNGTPSGSETYRFTGKPYSSSIGLYYYGARWYDPSVGRFVSPDPDPGYLSDPESLNPYVYVQNNPTGLVDPSEETIQCTDSLDLVCNGYNFFESQYTGVSYWNGLEPGSQQLLSLTAMIVLTVATAGADLPLVLAAGAIGFGIGAGGYTAYTYATGGTPTLEGALFWGSIGFAAGTIAYGGYKLLAARTAARSGEGSLVDASFASRWKTFSHWIRHGVRMGDVTPGQYVRSARTLLEEGFSGEAELFTQGSGTNIIAVRPGTGTFVMYDPVENTIKTYFTHRGGYQWIISQINFQGWRPFPLV